MQKNFQIPRWLGYIWRNLDWFRWRTYRTSIYKKIRDQFGIDTPAIQRPLFLVGTVRSGTTFIAEILGAHPCVQYVGFELSAEWISLSNMEIASPGLLCSDCVPLASEDLTQDSRESIRRGFSATHVHKGGWRYSRMLNKNPHLWNKLSFIRAVFPDAGLIVTGRDIRSTVASTKMLWLKMQNEMGIGHYLPPDPAYCWSCHPPAELSRIKKDEYRPGTDIWALADYWLRTYEMIEKQAAEFEAAVLIRQRDLVVNPKAVLMSVQRALGLPLLDYRLPVEIKPDRNQRWRELLDDDEKNTLEAFIEVNSQRIERLSYADTTL
jgi:hypothetical protein